MRGATITASALHLQAPALTTDGQDSTTRRRLSRGVQQTCVSVARTSGPPVNASGTSTNMTSSASKDCCASSAAPTRLDASSPNRAANSSISNPTATISVGSASNARRAADTMSFSQSVEIDARAGLRS